MQVSVRYGLSPGRWSERKKSRTRCGRNRLNNGELSGINGRIEQDLTQESAMLKGNFATST